jgi:hypothetical protein
MYLNAERIAILDKTVQDTFEQSSIAWQAIPHWDTGDPGGLRVRSDNAYAPEVTEGELALPIKPGDSLELEAKTVRFAVTVAQAIAPTPDALLAAVIARTVQLAGKVDDKVIGVMRDRAENKVTITTTQIQDLLDALIDARAMLERSGYRSPSCLLTDTAGLKALNNLQSGLSDFQSLLDAANINSVYRVDQLGTVAASNPTTETEPGTGGLQFNGKLLLLGRRQRIAHGGAAATSPGEEPVDLAVSVPPSLEVVGETDDGDIELSVRIRFAPRLTDVYGVVNVV